MPDEEFRSARRNALRFNAQGERMPESPPGGAI
jgi:hypothetical protein